MLEIFLSAGYAAIFIWIIRKMPLFRTENVSIKTFQLLFILKLVAAVCLYLIYTRFYPDRQNADILRYYDDSKYIYDAAFTSPRDFFRMMTGIDGNAKELYVYYDAMHNWFNSKLVFNDSRTMIRINAMMRFFTVGTYFPVAVMMSFIGMMGLTGIFRIFLKVLPTKKFWLIILVYLMPSTLLWTSGMIKETFLIFSIGLLLYTLHNYQQQKKLTPQQITGIVFFGFCLLNIKSYILFAIIPGIIAWMICNRMKNRKWITALSVHIIYFGFLIAAAPLITGSSVAELLRDKQDEFNHLAIREHAKSVIDLPVIENSTLSLVKNAPNAFIVVLCRPYPGESMNPLMILAALENLFLVGFCIFCLPGFRKSANDNLPAAFFLAIYFSIIMFILIGLVTPVIGAIVRYKVPAIPFLMFSFLCLAPADRFTKSPRFLQL